MFSQFVVLIVAAVLSGASAQVFSRSGCPTVQTQKTLDLQRVSTNFLFCFLRIHGPRYGINYVLGISEGPRLKQACSATNAPVICKSVLFEAVYSGDPDKRQCFVPSKDMGVKSLSMSHKKDARFKWVYNMHCTWVYYVLLLLAYSKTCLKRPLNEDQKLFFETDCRTMQVKSFCNTFDLHLATICH